MDHTLDIQVLTLHGVVGIARCCKSSDVGSNRAGDALFETSTWDSQIFDRSDGYLAHLITSGALRSWNVYLCGLISVVGHRSIGEGDVSVIDCTDC